MYLLLSELAMPIVFICVVWGVSPYILIFPLIGKMKCRFMHLRRNHITSMDAMIK